MFTDFEYAGKRLSDFGWITCHIDNRPGVSELDIGCDISFNTVKNNHSSIHYVTSTSYDNVCTSQPFEIMKNPCGKNQEDLYAIRDEIRVLTRWLNRHEYKKFKPLYDSDEWADIHYYGSFNVKEKTIGDKIIGLVLTFTGNAPYGFGEQIVNEIEMENNEVTSSGQVIYETDCAAVNPVNIKLFGKGKQKGNQLWRHGDITFEGQKSFDIDLEPGTYTFSAEVTTTDTDATTNLVYMLSGAVRGELTRGTRASYTFTLPQFCNVVTLYASNGSSAATGDTVTFKNVMLNPGNFALPLEEYVGGLVSIDNPQVPEFAGESGSIVGKVLTLQMLKPYTKETATNNGVTCVCNGDGTYSLSGTSEDYTSFALGELNCLNLGTYYLSTFDNLGSIGFQVVGGNAFDSFGQNMNKPIEITTKESSMAYVVILSAGINCDGITIRPMISKEPIEKFEPYTEQPFTFQTPNGLRGIPLGKTIPTEIANSPIHMSGVYWDSVEQQYYIGDTKNEDGKDVQRICKATMKPSDLEIGSAFTNTQLYYESSGVSFAQPLHDCHKAFLSVSSAYAYSYDDKEHYFVDMHGFKYFIPHEKIDDFLALDNFTVCYVLAEPIITDTTEQHEVVMNYPNTTIINDAGAYMEVTYLQDYDNTFTICGDSDEYTTLYPNISITCKRNGDLRIKNTLTGSVFEVLNCSKDETIYINGEHKYIDSDNQNHKETTFFNDFNYNYLDVKITDNDFNENIYETSIPCKIVIDYSPIRKVGV